MSYIQIKYFFQMFNLIWVDQYIAREIMKLYQFDTKDDVIHYPESRHGWIQPSW